MTAAELVAWLYGHGWQHVERVDDNTVKAERTKGSRQQRWTFLRARSLLGDYWRIVREHSR